MASPPPHDTRRTLRFLAIGATLLIVASLLFAAGALVDRRQRTLAAKQREIDNLALVLSSQIERVFEAGDLVIRGTVADIRTQPPLGGKTRREVETVLQARVSGIPPIRHVTIIDSSGIIRASSSPGIEGNLGATETLRFMRDVATDGAYTWRLTRYSGAGVIIPVLRPVITPEGKFGGVVALSLEPEYFRAQFESIARDAGDAIQMARNDGAVLASTPGYLTPEPVPAGQVFVTPLRDHVPSLRTAHGTRKGANGTELFARAYLTRFPMYVDISASEWQTLAIWRVQAAVIGTVVLVFACFAGLLAWRLYREAAWRETAERHLEHQARLFHSVFDTVPHPIFVKDAAGRYLEVNRAMADYWRMTPEQFRGREIANPGSRDPREIDANVAEDRMVLTQGRETSALRETTLPDGRVRQFHVIRRPLRDETGRITGLVGTAVDETDRLLAEGDLRSSQQLLRTMFDTLPHNIWVKNLEGRFIQCNRAMELFFGLTSGQILGQQVLGTEFRTPEEIDRTLQEDHEILTKGLSINEQRWTHARDGTPLRVHLIKYPLCDARGAIIGLIGVSINTTEGALAETALTENRALLATLIDTVPHHIWMKDREGKLRLANRSLLDYTGKPLEALQGVRIVGADYRSPEENERIAAEDQRVLEQGETIQEIQWATAPDGLKRRFHVVKRPLRDRAGQVAGLVGISMDVTAITRTEELLAQSQALLQAVFDALPLAVLVWDKERRLITSNRASEAMWGVGNGGMAGLSMQQLVPDPAQRQEADELDARVIREDRIIDHELDMTLPQGKTIRMRAIKAPLHGAGGEVTGLLAICEDITEQARAAEAVRESQALLKTVFDTIPLAVLVKNLDDRLLVVNPPTAARWGVLPEQLVGKRVKDLAVPEDERRTVEETDAQVVRENRTLDYELERTMPDGKTRRLRAIKAPLHGADGRVTGILGISEDITERHRTLQEKATLQRQLEQVQKMDTVGRLAGGVAHDFNNLLTPVIGFVDLAMSKIETDSPLRSDLAMIREAAGHAAELTRGLLSFSRSQVMTLRPVNLNEEIRSLNRMLSRVIGEGIEIVLNLDPALHLVSADVTQMQQVLMNLAVNARDAMPGGGKLVIESRNIELDAGYAERILETSPGRYVMVSVSDTGIGMSAETQTRIFEPFFTTKDVGKGTGLGLSIVYGIVRQHHGVIRVYSEIGRGTSFKLLFPRYAPGPDAAESTRRPLEQLRGSERILVVEDEARVRTAICALLASLGYDMMEAGSPQDALSLLDGRPDSGVSLLISDMMLPGKTGRELFADLKRRLPALNVLYMSGYPRDVLADKSAGVAQERFIGKPFGLQELAEKVRFILESGPPA